MSQSDFVSRGQSLVAAGQFQEAVKVCRLGLLGKPNAVDGRIVLGQALLALKRYDEVLAEMRVALELDRAAVPAQILKGEALLRKGDHRGAVETLHAALAAAPGDPKILQLLGQAEQASTHAAPSASHPAAAFVAGAADTKHYPNRDDSAADGEEDSGGGYTKPTTVAAPGSKRRSEPKVVARPDGTPSAEELAVGDSSGTVEVDPDLDAVELGEDLDFDALAPPPTGKPARGVVRGQKSGKVPPRGSKPVDVSKKASNRPSAPPSGETEPFDKNRMPRSVTEELDDASDLMDAAETHFPAAAAPPTTKKLGGTKVRDAVQLPAGPLEQHAAPPFGVAARSSKPEQQSAAPFGAAMRPGNAGPMDGSRPKEPPSPAGLAQVIAGQPHVMQVNPALHAPPSSPTLHAAAPPPALQAAPPPLGQVPRIAAAMPTMAALPPPPLVVTPPSAAAARPTIAVAPNQLPPPLAPPLASQMVHGAPEGPAWARATMVPGGPPRLDAAAYAQTAPAVLQQDPMRAASPVDAGYVPDNAAVEPASSPDRMSQPGVRRSRSPLAIVLWIVIGVVVIGGGVVAGLQIRALRLHKQIAAARDRANDLAKADTWTGWTTALGSLTKIADASHTIENLAALARARAIVAYEFYAGVDDAKAAVQELAGQGSLDGDLAAAYVALAQNDAKAAKQAADAALARASQDPAVQHVAGEAALLAGDLKAAVTYLQDATAHDPRPLYGVALARAHAAGSSWDDALAAIDRVLKASPDHPAALIMRANLLVASGRIATGSTAMDVRAQLDKLVAEGARPLAEQARGIAPAQIAFADLALARVDQARNDPTTARGDVRAASSVGLEDVRFAEAAVETLLAIGDPHARAETDRGLAMWPNDTQLRLLLAMQLLDSGRANEAEDALAKPSDLSSLPHALALRARAKLALGDNDGARNDFDTALKSTPDLESARIGRAELEIAAGDVDAARKLIEPRIGTAGASAAMVIAYAEVLRASHDPAQQAKAKDMLGKIVAGPPGADATQAQLELARIDRDLGQMPEAKSAYEAAARGGSFDARLETALLDIDDGRPTAGRDALEALLKDVGDPAPPALVLELARARMLVGDDAGAVRALEQASAMSNVTGWKLDRERGRLALRRGDFAGAATALDKAIEGGGGADSETFLLAADLAFGDDKRAAATVDRVRKLVPDRLKGQPEAQVIEGKLLLAQGKLQDALTQFTAASTALDAAKASSRRLAQPRFGAAVAKSQLAAGGKAQIRDALDELDLAIKYDPSLYPAYLFRAALLQDNKRTLNEALTVAKQGAELAPENADAWALVGQLAIKVGDRKTLALAIEKLGAIAPSSEALKELQHH